MKTHSQDSKYYFQIRLEESLVRFRTEDQKPSATAGITNTAGATPAAPEGSFKPHPLLENSVQFHNIDDPRDKLPSEFTLTEADLKTLEEIDPEYAHRLQKKLQQKHERALNKTFNPTPRPF